MSHRANVTYNGTLTNAGGDSDLLEITPADDKPVSLKRLILSQGSELGDAAEEQLRITIRRFGATVTSGSGGAAPSVELLDSADGAIAFASEANNTTVATTSGANDILFDFYWNVRQREEIVFPDIEDRPKARGTEVLLVRCDSTPADDITISITAEVVED